MPFGVDFRRPPTRQDPCMIYLATFTVKIHLNVGIYTRHGSYGYKPQPTPPVSTCLNPLFLACHFTFVRGQFRVGKETWIDSMIWRTPPGFNRKICHCKNKALQWTLPGTITYPYPIPKACGKISFFSYWWDVLVPWRVIVWVPHTNLKHPNTSLICLSIMATPQQIGELVVWIPGETLNIWSIYIMII